MIEDKKSMKSDELNIPDDYFNKRKNNEELMFEKKKHGLIRSFFFFWGLIIISLGIAALYLHFLGVLIFIIPLFLIYVRVSHNNEEWKKNFDIIMSNNVARLFAYAVYLSCLILFLILAYKFFKINFNLNWAFADKFIDFIISVLSRH